VKRNDFLKVLKSEGLVFFRHGSNHDIYMHQKTGKKIPIPRHGEIKNTVVTNIMKEIPKQ
jgi:predicted RNA binding protein YcfA (HicA-like mRNA interferase family)